MSVSTADHPGARGARLDRRGRPSRNAGPAGALRDHAETSSTTSACARWRSCRRSRRSPRPCSSSPPPRASPSEPAARRRRQPPTSTAATEHARRAAPEAARGGRPRLAPRDRDLDQAGRVTRRGTRRQARGPRRARATRSWSTASPSSCARRCASRACCCITSRSASWSRAATREGRRTVFARLPHGPLGRGRPAGPQQLRPAAVHRFGRARQPADASALRDRARVRGRACAASSNARDASSCWPGVAAGRRPGALRPHRSRARSPRAPTAGTGSCCGKAATARCGACSRRSAHAVSRLRARALRAGRAAARARPGTVARARRPSRRVRSVVR